MVISRHKPGKAMLLAFAALLWMAGCAPVFSRQALDQVDRSISFHELQSDPEHYQGKWVMLAGVIINTNNTNEGTFVEVLQKPMGRRGRPLDTDVTGGRFIISSAQFLDAAVYLPGRLITVIGEAAGRKVQPIGEIEYRYPVVTAKELHLWEPSAGPQFMFGVGIYHGY
jgi:outer membrane lipoprotein